MGATPPPFPALLRGCGLELTAHPYFLFHTYPVFQTLWVVVNLEETLSKIILMNSVKGKEKASKDLGLLYLSIWRASYYWSTFALKTGHRAYVTSSWNDNPGKTTLSSYLWSTEIHLVGMFGFLMSLKPITAEGLLCWSSSVQSTTLFVCFYPWFSGLSW